MTHEFDPELAEWATTLPVSDLADVDATRTIMASLVAGLARPVDVSTLTVDDRTTTATAENTAVPVRVYRPTSASWYGPGLLGGRTACGGTLNATTLGVANRSLPCGTKVTFHYRGRTVTAKVIDRGPFAGGREFDLTAATRQALHFPDVGTVLSSR